MLTKELRCDNIHIVARLVGQGVKTSPSHGENTSSILVLAARNFRSDSEVFLLFEYIPAWVMPSLFVQKDAAKQLFSSTLRRLDSDFRSQNLNFFAENLRKQVHRRQLLHFSILQSHITIQRLSLFFLIHFNFLFFHILRRFCRDEDSGIFMFFFFL